MLKVGREAEASKEQGGRADVVGLRRLGQRVRVSGISTGCAAMSGSQDPSGPAGRLDFAKFERHTQSSPMPSKPQRPVTDPFSTTEKLMQTFRMPRELVVFLRGEAD